MENPKKNPSVEEAIRKLKEAEDQIIREAGFELPEEDDPHPENRFIERIRKDIQTPEPIQAKASQLESYEKELEQEEIKLEGLYQQVEALREKLGERLELTKNLRKQNERIKKELKELGEEIVLVKKENETFLYKIKDLENFHD